MSYLLILLFAVAGVGASDPDTTQPEQLDIGTEAPSCYAYFLNGGDFFLSRYVGPKARSHLKGPIVLSFFTTSCIPCRKEIPYLHALQENYPDVKVFLVDVGEEPEHISNYIKSMGYTLPVLLDRYGKISEKYFAKVTPTLVTINTDGIIGFYKQGYSETDNKVIKQAFERLIAPAKH
jgi:thiol-disulfide isomerase/thioredoxin